MTPGGANHGEDLARNGHRGPDHQVLAGHPCRDQFGVTGRIASRPGPDPARDCPAGRRALMNSVELRTRVCGDHIVVALSAELDICTAAATIAAIAGRGPGRAHCVIVERTCKHWTSLTAPPYAPWPGRSNRPGRRAARCCWPPRPERLARVLDLTGLGEALGVHASVASALASAARWRPSGDSDRQRKGCGPSVKVDSPLASLASRRDGFAPASWPSAARRSCTCPSTASTAAWSPMCTSTSMTFDCIIPAGAVAEDCPWGMREARLTDPDGTKCESDRRSGSRFAIAQCPHDLAVV